MNTIDVMLCVNNPNNGAFCGRCCAVQIADFIELDARVLPEPRCHFGDGYFGIHRRHFQYKSCTDWVGNWCWDLIRVTPDVAAYLIEVLLDQKWKHPHLGDSFVNVWGFDSADGAAIALMKRHAAKKPISRAQILRAMLAPDGGVHAS